MNKMEIKRMETNVRLLQQCAHHLKRCSIRYNGIQSCIYVHDRIYSELIHILRKMETKYGNQI